MTAYALGRRDAPWHARLDCRALDDEKLVYPDAPVIKSLGPDPQLGCLACDPDQEFAKEWVLTARNAGQLMNVITAYCKPYIEDSADGLVCVGLTIRENGRRQVARFGDTIRWTGTGYTVTPKDTP